MSGDILTGSKSKGTIAQEFAKLPAFIRLSLEEMKKNKVIAFFQSESEVMDAEVWYLSPTEEVHRRTVVAFYQICRRVAGSQSSFHVCG